jgi:hypothetical protein
MTPTRLNLELSMQICSNIWGGQLKIIEMCRNIAGGQPKFIQMCRNILGGQPKIAQLCRDILGGLLGIIQICRVCLFHKSTIPKSECFGSRLDESKVGMFFLV